MGEHAAFFYGTLMAPGVLYRVIYGSHQPEPWQQALTTVRPAIIEGYQRHQVRALHYPAVVPSEGSTVRGSVCTGLTDGDIWRLDIFEGDEYYKAKVKVKILKDEVGLTQRIPDDKLNEYIVDEIEASVYIWQESERYRLEPEEWDFEAFRATNMRKWTGEEQLPEGGYIDEGFGDVRRAVNIEQSKTGAA